MWKRMLPFACIAVGIVIFLYPTLVDRYESYKQEQILAVWEQNLRQLDADTSAIPESVPSEPANERSPVPLQEIKPSTVAAKQPSSAEANPKAIDEAPVEGVLIIDKIKLKLPILTDATPAHLKLSVGSMLHTGKPGEIGNYAIAGHRNRTYGKNFNRLDEMDVGDTIKVQTNDGHSYVYQVESKQYVLPTQVEVLEGNGKDSEITLITCHPMKNPTHRIIVKGKLVRDSA